MIIQNDGIFDFDFDIKIGQFCLLRSPLIFYVIYVILQLWEGLGTNEVVAGSLRW